MRPHARTFRTLSNLDFPVVWIMCTESRRGFWENLKGYYDTIRKWFPQHNIAGLISGITFTVLFQSGEASTVEGNKHTHTHTHTPPPPPHPPPHTKTANFTNKLLRNFKQLEWEIFRILLKHVSDHAFAACMTVPLTTFRGNFYFFYYHIDYATSAQKLLIILWCKKWIHY